MPEGSWKGTEDCNLSFKSGDTLSETWKEGSPLKEYIFKITGGTGKFAGAKGGGTYKSDQYAFQRHIRRQDRAAVVCPLVRKRKAGPFGGRIGPAKWTRGEASK